jgi:hypothetical protein
VRLALLALGVWAALGWGGASSAQSDPGHAVRGAFLYAFANHRLVAFAEEHQDTRQHAFLRALVRDPRFAERVDDVVVEFGNARYQRLADRWLLNRRPGVTLARVRRAWTDTTQGSVWHDPVYEAFFRAVRAANMRVPPSARVRVLLGDPPIVWSRVRTNADYERWIARRGPHYVSVVERLVLARARRALLVAGAGHLLRHPDHAENETGVLESRHGPLQVVLAQPSGVPPARLVDALGQISPPAFLPLRGTALGALPASSVFGREPSGAGTLAERADTFLYLGTS